jgi:hypothetical protein
MLFFIIYVHLFSEFCCVATPNPKTEGPSAWLGSAVLTRQRARRSEKRGSIPITGKCLFFPANSTPVLGPTKFAGRAIPLSKAIRGIKLTAHTHIIRGIKLAAHTHVIRGIKLSTHTHIIPLLRMCGGIWSYKVPERSQCLCLYSGLFKIKKLIKPSTELVKLPMG